MPSALVSFSAAPGPILGRTGGTFNGLLDLYPLTRIPLLAPSASQSYAAVDSGTRPTELALYQVDRRIPGAELAPPTVGSSG